MRDLLSLETGFDVVPTWAIDELKTHCDDIANLLAERDRKALTATLENALATGMSSQDTATALRETFDAGITIYDDHGIVAKTVPADSWFTTVARTELQRASNLGQFALYEKAGIEKVRWQAAEPCDECSEADDQIVNLGDVFPGVDVDMPPAHPNCAPPGTMVETDLGLRPIEDIRIGDRVLTHRNRFREVLALSRTDFSDDLVELRVGPHVLRVTGNHPVLAGDRWAPSASLKPGDEIACVDAESVFAASSQVEHVPAECPQCGRLHLVLRRFALSLVPASAVDLYGEHAIRNRDIDSKDVDDEVWLRANARQEERVEHDLLVSRFDLTGVTAGVTDPLFDGNDAATSSLVSRSRKRLPTIGPDTIEPHDVSLRSPPPSEAEPPKAVSQNDPPVASANRNGERKDRLTREMTGVQIAELIVRQEAALRLKSRHVARVRIDSASRVSFTGTVYNFAVADDESYVAEGVVVHNCRCVLIPSDEDLGDFGGSAADRAAARRGNQPASDEES